MKPNKRFFVFISRFNKIKIHSIQKKKNQKSPITPKKFNRNHNKSQFMEHLKNKMKNCVMEFIIRHITDLIILSFECEWNYHTIHIGSGRE